MEVDGTDGRLGRYLLGDLTPEEDEQVEIEYLAGDEATALVQEAEDDLVDDYARGRLSPRDARRFEERLLSRPGMPGRVAFARTLAAQRPPQIRSLARPWLAWTAAVLLAGVSIGLGSGLYRQRRVAAGTDAAARERIAALESTVTEQQERLRAVPPPGNAPLVVELRDGAHRGPGGPRNEIEAPGEAWVLLRLLVGEHLYPSYVARIETADGRVIKASLPAVRREAPAAAEVMVPGADLKAGTYVVMLEGVEGADRETVGGFPLQVRRR
jgi:hypothetical protein